MVDDGDAEAFCLFIFNFHFFGNIFEFLFLRGSKYILFPFVLKSIGEKLFSK